MRDSTRLHSRKRFSLTSIIIVGFHNKRCVGSFFKCPLKGARHKRNLLLARLKPISTSTVGDFSGAAGLDMFNIVRPLLLFLIPFFVYAFDKEYCEFERDSYSLEWAYEPNAEKIVFVLKQNASEPEFWTGVGFNSSRVSSRSILNSLCLGLR